MESAEVAYLSLWFAVFIYVGWMASRQRRLAQTLEALRKQLGSESRTAETSHSKI
ncbi:MAG: hypothetical protein KDB03_10860 [Planctomycetales bacterium]|nr:hypothetical protein [Planctomycetales bacterium]